jgi:hypothetical protein
VLCKNCTDRGLTCCAQGRIFNNMLYVSYVYLTKAKPIHKTQAHSLVREGVTLGLWGQGFSYGKKL